MKSHEEFMKTVREKAEKYEAERKRRSRAIRNVSLLLAICVMISLSVYLTAVLSGASDKVAERAPTDCAPVETGGAPMTTDMNHIDTKGTEGVGAPSDSGESDETAASQIEPTSYATYVDQTTSMAQFTAVPSGKPLYTTGVTQGATSPYVRPDDTPGTGINYSMCTVYPFPDFYEHFELIPDRRTLEERLGGKMDLGLFASEFYTKNVVYALWVRHDAFPYLLPKEVTVDGEPYFRLTEKTKSEKENNYLLLVAVSKSHSRYGGFIAPDNRIIPDTEG